MFLSFRAKQDILYNLNHWNKILKLKCKEFLDFYEDLLYHSLEINLFKSPKNIQTDIQTAKLIKMYKKLDCLSNIDLSIFENRVQKSNLSESQKDYILTLIKE